MTPEPVVPTPRATASVTIEIAAANMVFDTETIKVPAGAEVTVNFDNKDENVPHNVSVYTDSSAANDIFIGDIITGPARTVYRFVAPEAPGTYYFQCDIHPFMSGDFVVE